ncbi:MAG: succinate dehydrogenase, hydrophobic membrane anchor protein [Gammaproteobacteria bacterium]|nr:succinate dehydrogenase, hydrophobic membrane anchor protein [Gammaproteobacteria bacterium]
MSNALRHPLQRVRGLGSAKDGTNHWWWQRVTAIALVPLTLWFISAVVGHAGQGHDAVIAWIQSPHVTVLLLALIAATFYHMQLGVQVVIEDYVHVESVKLAALIALKFAAILMALTAALAVLTISLGTF